MCVQGQVKAFGEERLGVSPLVASREVASLAPLHGPVVHNSMAELLRMYRCAQPTELSQEVRATFCAHMAALADGSTLTCL